MNVSYMYKSIERRLCDTQGQIRRDGYRLRENMFPLMDYDVVFGMFLPSLLLQGFVL